jgi:hypothetical protein
MRRRYIVFGLSATLALALAVPALGGPSNPVASSAASAKKLANKALRKANEANAAAQSAQSTANQALSTAQSAQNAAQSAQTTANQANTHASHITDEDLGLTLVTGNGTSANTGGLDSATAIADCDTQTPISAMGAVTSGTTTALTGAFIFYEPVATGKEIVNTGATFDIVAQGFCINDN